MDKLTIVMSNYIDVECDANTTPRQAYERGFRRAAEKCETVMRSRKTKNDALESENAKLRELIADVHEALRADKAGMFHKLILASMEDDMRELGIEIDR